MNQKVNDGLIDNENNMYFITQVVNYLSLSA